jgi:hypothetical protein
MGNVNGDCSLSISYSKPDVDYFFLFQFLWILNCHHSRPLWSYSVA